MTEIKVRTAGARDASNIVRLLFDWFNETDLGWPQPDDVDMLAWVTDVMQKGRIFVAERSGRLIGVVGIKPQVFSWNRSAWYFGDSFFFVAPAYRRGGVANALMKAVQTHAASAGLPLVMGIITGRNTDALQRWYRIQGGEYAGGIMAFGIERLQRNAEAAE
jgi:GNAT superfamily N-acetyltransferase